MLEKEAFEIREVLGKLKKINLSFINEEDLKNIISYIDYLRRFILIQVHETPIGDIYRIRKNKFSNELKQYERFHLLQHLKYPPVSNCGMGRANIPRLPVLYASFSKLIAMIELKPQKGEMITVSQWKMRGFVDTLRIAVICQDDKITRAMPFFKPYLEIYNKFLEEKDPLEASIVKEIMAYLCGEFTKPVETGKSNEYLVSAYFSNLLLYSNSNNVEAVVYPSVPTSLSDVNIAIHPKPFDGMFMPVMVSEEIVGSDISETKNSFYSSRTATARKFDRSNDSILWEAV